MGDRPVGRHTGGGQQFATRGLVVAPDVFAEPGAPGRAIFDQLAADEATTARHYHDETAVLEIGLLLIESGGDNLAATFSPELADLVRDVIDVSAGDKIPRNGGPGITGSDLLTVNKTDLALLGQDRGRFTHLPRESCPF